MRARSSIRVVWLFSRWCGTRVRIPVARMLSRRCGARVRICIAWLLSSKFVIYNLLLNTWTFIHGSWLCSIIFFQIITSSPEIEPGVRFDICGSYKWGCCYCQGMADAMEECKDYQQELDGCSEIKNVPLRSVNHTLGRSDSWSCMYVHVCFYYWRDISCTYAFSCLFVSSCLSTYISAFWDSLMWKLQQ